MTILTVTGKKPSNKGQKLSCCHIISWFNVAALAQSSRRLFGGMSSQEQAQGWELRASCQG